MFGRSALILLMFFAGILGCSRSPESTLDEMVDIGTHHLHIRCGGSGSPTVVLDTGVGKTYESWEMIVEAISRETRVCTYERTGYGQSEPGPMPRDSQRAADELHTLLVNAGEDRPMILVGHSIGALNLQVYTQSFPENVEGLVLLDPTPVAWLMGDAFPELLELFDEETDSIRQAADQSSESEEQDAAEAASFLNAVASEHEELFGRTGNQVAAIDSFDNVSLTIIGATEPDPRFGEYAQAFRQFWNAESQKLAEKAEASRFILAEGSSHHINLDSPQRLSTRFYE